MIKRVLSVLLVLAFLALTACNSKTVKKESEKITSDEKVLKTTEINLLYNKADCFNPYTAETDNNRNLCSLIFEPLVKTDNNLNPVLRLASDIKINGTKCTVTIKNTKFSDGTAVSAEDVIYSYKTAKNYGGLYSSHLYEVTSASVVSAATVEFSLSRKDPFIKNLLDFPIIKSGSDKITDSDGVLLSPIGCGRYVISDDKTSFVQNENFFGEKGNIKKINLINAPDNDSISHYIEVGANELYYTDMSDGDIIRMSGKKVDVNLNNLVYIGMNIHSTALSNKYLRYAISSAIDRQNICSKCYFDSAVPATGYFNPCLKEVEPVQSIKTSADTKISVENLSKLGYNSKDENGYYINSKGKHIVLRLLVNKENRYKVLTANRIASDLKSAGIEIKVVETSFSDYTNSLTNNSFELYLGEIAVLPNFDMSALVLGGGSCAYGIKKVEKSAEKGTAKANDDNNDSADDTLQEPIADIINNYYNGICSLSDVSVTLLTEMVQIPILYRNGLFFYKDNIASGVESTKSDIYYSIENYIIK